jgi:hypothetical protein
MVKLEAGQDHVYRPFATDNPPSCELISDPGDLVGRGQGRTDSANQRNLPVRLGFRQLARCRFARRDAMNPANPAVAKIP